MFPSSGLFAGITCPVSRRGRCERPHCFYGHAAAEDDGHATIVDLTGEDSDGPPEVVGAPVTPGVSDQHFHELERLNKEIESMKQEVEQEQRRLSSYTSRTPSGSGVLVHQNKKIPVQTRKYLVDNSRPRTDLEYDPLSNFSAALRSYSSSGKKSKKTQEWKSSKPEEKEVKTSGLESPEVLEDTREDSVLVIDEVPENPSALVQKHVAGEALLCVQQNLKVSTALDSSSRTAQETGPSLICGSSAGGAAALWSSHQNVQNQSHPAPEKSGSAEKPDLQQHQTPGQSSAPPPQNPSSVGSQENPAPLSPHTSTVSPSEDLRSRTEPSGDRTVIEIHSSPEDEGEEDCSYLDVELSDSDPMEECYRIFMEANEQQERPDQEEDAEKLLVNAGLQASAGKKRVAHDAKTSEQPQAKSRPQPQVLVPLREQTAPAFGPRASKIQQVQQRASMLTASVKAGRAFVTATSQRSHEDTRTAATPPPAHLQSAPPQNTYVNYIPVGTTVIEVGNNLHLILPQGAFPLPVASTSSPLPAVLTPVGQVHPNGVKQTNRPAAVIPVARSRSAAPAVVVAPPARRPALAAASLPPPQTTSKPSKRKLKQQSEASKEKVPHNVRQRYVNMFTEEFLKSTSDVNEAFQKALSEEKSVFNRSANKLKYLSVAVNALKRLKNQSAAASKSEDVSSQRSKGNIPLSLTSCTGKADDSAFYESLKDYVLSDERMIENNYPVQHPEKPGYAVLFTEKKTNPDPLKRICCRCGSTYSVSQSGKHVRKEECNYHYGKGVENRVPGGVETRYSCCQGVMGAPACQLFKLHVHDSLSMEGFMSTAGRTPSDPACPGVYSLDCEMCYTVHGLELSRVTVIGSDLQVVYDAFVKPDSEVIDYNTRFSGIGEKDVTGTSTSLKEVQQTLLQFINADTILIGHGLETDLCLLKLLHGKVVDTSVVFPHRLGPPHKLSLNQLTAEYLRRIIQERVCGHDTAEDATACMELMLWRVKEDGKMKR